MSAFIRFKVPGSLDGSSGNFILRTVLLCACRISTSTASRMTFFSDVRLRATTTFNSRNSGSGKSMVVRIKVYWHIDGLVGEDLLQPAFEGLPEDGKK